MEEKPKKSRAIIITIIALIMLSIVIFLLYQNRDNLLGTKSMNKPNENIFQSLFGTSKSKNLEIIDSLNSNKNGVSINAEAGEDIKKGDLLYKYGVNKNGDPVVKKIKSTIRKGENSVENELEDFEILGIAIEDINTGKIGKILVPDFSLYNNSLWEIIKEDTVNIIGDIRDWVVDIFIPNSNTDITIQDGLVCSINGQTVPCSDIGNLECISAGNRISCLDIYNYDLLSLVCKKNGLEIDCKDLINIECKKDGVIVSCKDFITTDYKFPIVNVISNPTNIAVGESSVISWTSENTTSCMKDDGTPLPISGEFNTGPLNESVVYSIICSGDYGTTGGSSMVLVGGDTDNIPFPIVSVYADPIIVSAGQTSNITWSSQNANYCMKDDGTPLEIAGSFTTDPIMLSTSYTIICEGDLGYMSGSAIVSVGGGDYNPLLQCSDGIDNDGDNSIDSLDSSCHTDFDVNNPDSYDPNIFSESRSVYLPECSDTIDNDNDTFIDIADPECYTDGVYNPDIYFENGSIPIPIYTTDPACSDGFDNDYDGLTDISDPECHSDSNPENIDSYISFHTSESFVSDILPECGDFLDNDYDGLVDKDDPSCHTNFNSSDNKSYQASLDDESATRTDDTNICAVLEDYPLEFTKAEEAELKELLRRFYIIAPKLKNEDDIKLVYKEAESNKDLVEEVKSLTNECYAQSVPKGSSYRVAGYDGPILRYGNPWYKPEERGAYIEETTDLYSDAYKSFVKSELYDIVGTKIMKTLPSRMNQDEKEEILDTILNEWSLNVANENKNIYQMFEQVFNIW